MEENNAIWFSCSLVVWRTEIVRFKVMKAREIVSQLAEEDSFCWSWLSAAYGNDPTFI